MQQNSIHNPTPVENDSEQNPFPTAGDNFTTVVCLDGVTDPMALLEGIDFLDDCAMGLAAFHEEEKRTGTL